MLSPGDAAAGVTLPDQDGNSVSLTDFAAKRLSSISTPRPTRRVVEAVVSPRAASAGPLRGPSRLDPHAPFIDLVVQERAHELLVRSVSQRLRFPAEGRRVFTGIRWAFLDQASGEDLVGRPGIDGVGSRLDLEGCGTAGIRVRATLGGRPAVIAASAFVTSSGTI